ncbi:MAG TPA: ParM/StbA family protein [Phototrophicaceae bacterium]|nr:ParM/StbA family protein [Phototrophicaceae bacterium]
MFVHTPGPLKVVNTSLYAFDAGNGLCKGLSGEIHSLVQFEPIVAPMTDQRALHEKDERPAFSLVSKGRTEVFGIDDVFRHGKRTAIRRFNSPERYTSQDYFHMIDVLFMKCFPKTWDADRIIRPTGVINIPINIYNNAEVVETIRANLIGQRTLTDAQGDSINLEILPDRLMIVPESYGALMHYAYDPATLRRRPNTDTTGTTLVVDIGYETTDMSLFEGLHYQRDRTESEPRSGMGVVTRAIQNSIRQQMRNADVSRIDRAMQPLAGIPAGERKEIDPMPGVTMDVTEIYDETIADLAPRIAQEVLTRFPDHCNRVLLAGGGAYHMAEAIQPHLRPLKVVLAPEPELANVLGGFTMLNIQAQSGMFLDQSSLPS